MWGLASLIILLSTECIEIMHVGSQDVPVGGVRVCVGPKGRSREDSLYKNVSTFYFDEATYRGLETFVVEHQAQAPWKRDEVFTSFSVAWSTKEGMRKYILSRASTCSYLDELVRSVDRAHYTKFIQHGEGLMAREGCSRSPDRRP